MKRFLRFNSLRYDALGGALDFTEDFDTLEEAQKNPPKEDDEKEEASILDQDAGYVYAWQPTWYNVNSDEEHQGQWEQLEKHTVADSNLVE